MKTLRPRIGTIPSRLTTATASTQRDKRESTRTRILRRDCGLCKCRECQRNDALKAAHHVDHDVPLWAGGSNDDGNLASINRDCHAAKSTCEARMRAAGGWLATPCTCGRHQG